MLELEDGTEWYVAIDSETAGEKVREYWEDMIKHDKEEFTCIVGKDALIAWCLGERYAPGSIGVNSLEEWLELTTEVPNEHFAGYDGNEIELKSDLALSEKENDGYCHDSDKELQEELGFIPGVAYRHN